MKLRLIRNPIWDEIEEELEKELATMKKREKELPCRCPDEGMKPKLKHRCCPRIKSS
jgi:hypothetical protein